MGKRKPKSDIKGALEDLGTLVLQDKISECEVFIRDNLDLVKQAIARGYNATDLSEMLKARKVGGTSPTAVNRAIDRYAPGLIQRKPKKGASDSTTATAGIPPASTDNYEDGDYEEEDYEGEEAA